MTPGTSHLMSSTPTATSCRIMSQYGLQKSELPHSNNLWHTSIVGVVRSIGDYCSYSRSTFTLPKQLSGGVLGDTVAGPGVGAYNPR